LLCFRPEKDRKADDEYERNEKGRQEKAGTAGTVD